QALRAVAQDGHEAPRDGLEEREHFLIARAVDRRRANDGDLEIGLGVGDEALGGELRSAVVRDGARLAIVGDRLAVVGGAVRGEARNEDETPYFVLSIERDFEQVARAV